MKIFRKEVKNNGSVNPWLTGPDKISDDEFIFTPSYIPPGTASLVEDGVDFNTRFVHKVPECRYCGRKNTINIGTCEGCGAPL